jgi:hypothetical protein
MQRSSFIIGLVLAASMLAACSSKYQVDAVQIPVAGLGVQSRFYVMLPRDGVYGSKTYVRSGQMTTTAVYQALVTRGAEAEQATKIEDEKTVIAEAKKNGFDYVFVPTILHWEDRATEWSGKLDRLTMHYAVYEAGTGKEVASTTIRASSKWATFGGDHPQDLLPKTTRQFVDQLF